jgi:hypothetical protein
MGLHVGPSIVLEVVVLQPLHLHCDITHSGLWYISNIVLLLIHSPAHIQI